MPYKNKEDRTEAVRRHRRRKREKKAMSERSAKVDASLGGLLRLIGFEEVEFEDWVEVIREFEKDDEGVWHDRKRGKIVYPPRQVFFGLNTVICGEHLDKQIYALLILFQALFDYEDENTAQS